MFFSKKYNFIYLPTSKSGSHAISKICIDIFEAKPMTPIDIGESCGIGCKFAAHSVFLPTKLKHCYLFASVRNPYSREVSKYNWMLRKPSPKTRKSILDKFGNLDFLSYIKWVCDNEKTNDWENNVWKESQVDTIFRQPIPKKCQKITHVDKILKCENLYSDIKSLPFIKEEQIHNIKKILSKRINSSKMQKCEIKTFPKNAQKIFCDRFIEDFIKFNYKIDCIPISNKHNFFI